MARKPKRPLHPLRMAEALEAMNEAAFAFAGVAETVVTLLRREPAAQVLTDDLATALEAFRAAFWPEED